MPHKRPKKKPQSNTKAAKAKRRTKETSVPVRHELDEAHHAQSPNAGSMTRVSREHNSLFDRHFELPSRYHILMHATRHK